jgi:hypothetical protein
MSLKDKLEIGLKPDAPYRPDNLPEFQQDDPNCQEGSRPGHSISVAEAREDCDEPTSPRRAARPKAAPVTTRRAAATRTAAGKNRPAVRSTRSRAAGSRSSARAKPGAKAKR